MFCFDGKVVGVEIDCPLDYFEIVEIWFRIPFPKSSLAESSSRRQCHGGIAKGARPET